MMMFPFIPSPAELKVSKQTEDMVLYKPFLLINPETDDTFPPTDEPYYTALEMTLRHLLFKYEKGWITSERQIIHTSDECISAVHFLFDEENKVNQINVFQRSSNLFNLEDDVQFFNYFIKKYLRTDKVQVEILVSAPHIFKGKSKKIED